MDLKAGRVGSEAGTVNGITSQQLQDIDCHVI